jgi:hypothetical protein
MSDPRASKGTLPSSPRYDESDWPIFRVTMPRVTLSDAAFQAHLDACSQRYKPGEPFCMLIDMAEHPPLGAARRKAVADRMTEDARRVPGVMLGCALVVQSAPSRGGVTAINWLAQPQYRFIAFGDLHEARKWLVQVLEHHRIVLR